MIGSSRIIALTSQLIFLSIIIVSCNTETCYTWQDCEQTSERQPVVNLNESSLSPARFDLADHPCQESRPHISIETSSMYAWQNYDLTNETKKFETTQSMPHLENSAFHAVYFGEQWQRYCEISAATPNFNCTDNDGAAKPWTLVPSSSQKLKICTANSNYERLSVESVALSTSYYAEKAVNFYKKIKKDHLRPMKLSVLPHFVSYYDFHNPDENTIERHPEYITHNAAYFSDSNMMVIFPEDEFGLQNLAGYFWESGFVIAHELGHHIESELIKNLANEIKSSSTMNDVHSLIWDGSQHRYRVPPTKQIGLTGENLAAFIQIRTALSEALADLLAYYVEQGSASLIGLPCIGGNRSVDNDYFLDGQEKTINDLRWENLTNSQSTYSSSCSEPNFSDPHIFGAVMANYMDNIWRILLTPSAESPQFDKRYELTLATFESFIILMSKAPSISADLVFERFHSALELSITSQLNQAPANAPETDQAPIKQAICKLSRTKVANFSPLFAQSCQ